MEVLFERVAGLDIGKASLPVCAARPVRVAGAVVRRGRSRPGRGRWR
jgi:hypothetical protein